MSEDADWNLISPFWIDTDAYSDRDRLLFCCGYEFADLLQVIRHHDEEYHAAIHRENESRIRLACGRFGRKCVIDPCQLSHDPDGSWSYLTILKKE